eukprot:TRINITY_DN6217_c0_g2_i1.p1 TRINITY_DN6217_c0_g2~~TRINITY_DN6217_c0_g2_i1.p1  ORF type:complete len:796 (+),score=164.54 TRINITY_DN6217_c0_g2_i1:70-2457(+)
MNSTAAVVDEDLAICRGGGGQWLPLGGTWEESLDDRLRSILYFSGMIYSFIGVSIVADMFMAAIERVTSVQNCVREPGSKNRYRTSPIWNETVANLTLMALGSSAPEIMLSLNDIVKRTFVQGKLGASTIVGSAAFNLFVIIAVCVNAIPAGESRQIKETGVYAITAVWSIFAYLWLFFIVAINGPDAVDVVEGTLTFLYFPILVAMSYYADIGVLTIDNIKSAILPKSRGLDADRELSWLEQFKVDNFREGDLDEEEKARRREEAERREAARIAKFGVSAAGEEKTEEIVQKSGGRCSRLRKCCCCCFRRSRKRQEGARAFADVSSGSFEAGESIEQVNTYLSDPNLLLIDDEGEPLENDYGILTFPDYSMVIDCDDQEKEVTINVVRKNGSEGKVTVNYRMEQLSAIPGFDYEDDEGELQFRDGVTTAELVLTILPKKVGEMSDRFQVVLEDPTGGAEFNPDFDGGEDCQRLTVILRNTLRENKPWVTFLDKVANLDELRQGTELWKEQIWEMIYVGGSKESQDEAGFLEWVNHLLWLPWTSIFALLTPPPAYLGGWVCFVVSLGHIAWLTILIGDLAELFGCVVGIDDNITAISFVALGTSVPDLFASMTAAKQDEYADASIVNVTGSNSVNVFLGIGLPWMMAAFYHRINNGTTFEVTSGDLGFSVIAFTTGALTTLAVIQIRRWKYGGELGGPSDIKAYSSCLLVLLWLTYLGLSTWKFSSPDASLGEQFAALGLAIPAVMTMMGIFAAIRIALRLSKDYIGEEGFWGIFITFLLIGFRIGFLMMFQMEG